MTTSDEFKAKLKAGEIVDALTLALSEAVELEITTWVSSGNSDSKSAANVEQSSPGYRMRTRMNIVDGDINNEIGTHFIGNGPYTELRKFHMEQVLEGRQIIRQNLESIQQLFTVIASTLSQLPQDSRQIKERNSLLSPSPEDELK
ncbi:MAG: hypothetical protein F6J86_05900 [Symploca sp. SIO1B1]|nr:hypothetical protein [Symploca sp. SIO2D2]NER22148.1 hypothetical protein [Symploca sp. SIO1C2]NER47905.1 hypothetical protein [Symploca sp. SIO1A3]NER93355.1 hypothetical protein [Symploca sp. SIO1B1]